MRSALAFWLLLAAPVYADEVNVIISTTLTADGPCSDPHCTQTIDMSFSFVNPTGAAGDSIFGWIVPGTVVINVAGFLGVC
jgi:hypothetical protein